MGLRYLADPSPDLISQTVTKEALVMVCSKEHRLADGRRHQARDLAGEPWVAFPSRGSRESFVQFLERRLLQAGIENPRVIPIDSLTAQKRLVEAGFGIALLAESGVQEELRHGTLKLINVPGLRASLPVSLVYRRNGYLSPAARNLLSTITVSVSS